MANEHHSALSERDAKDLSTDNSSTANRPITPQSTRRPSEATSPSTHSFPSAHQSNLDLSKSLSKDIEKGAFPESISSIPNPQDSSLSNEKASEEENNPNIVFWDGPNDPENPMNWSPFQRWGMVSLVSIITFVTPLASSMFAPGVPQVMQTFHSTNDMLSGFMLSVYVLGFAFGPMFFAPLSEMYGRLPLYHICNAVFLVFTIAAAVSTDMGMFITFRFFMGCFGGAPIVLGGGTIADLIPIQHRFTAMTVWMMGPTLGPCVGPVLGGVFTEAKGWRWNFWFVAIVTGAVMILSWILMRETSGVVILERKARRLRKETGNLNLRSKLDKGLTPKELFWFSITRPLKMLFLSPICFSMSLYIAVTYAYLYILFTTFTTVYRDQYGWHGVSTGLSFLGIGIGSFTSQLAFTWWENKKVKRRMAKGTLVPEHRLHLMAQWCWAMPVGLFWYGWSVEKQTHWISPILATALVGLGMLTNFNPANTYIVDVFTVHSASAMAAATILRSLMAALIPLSSQKMYAALGYGWGNSLLGFIALAMCPLPFLFIKYGERIRKAEKVKF